VAFNYGGRAEIVDAVRKIIAEGYKPEEVDEDLISSHLYTAGIPDPDLIIRTAGEMRLSNFLLWQSAYAEYYSTPVYWPDFDEEELYKALLDFSRRERRFGLVKEG
jgi:undecaprenyl diphosphate synthase